MAKDKIDIQLNWLKSNAQFLSIKAIEEAVGCPPTTIQQFVGKANRPIPGKWGKKIALFILSMKK